MDLRERVALACDAGDATREQIAERYFVWTSPPVAGSGLGA